MINIGDIKLEEYDLYTQDTETILNRKFMSNGFMNGGVIKFGNELFLRYYRLSNRPSEYENVNEVIEEAIILQYETNDFIYYVLKNINEEIVTRKSKRIELEEIW